MPVKKKEESSLRAAYARIILRTLKRLFPNAEMMLTYRNDWELLVAVQLSAQCTDKKVNEVTPALFARYPTLSDYVKADPREFERLIYQTGFYRNKTRNILAAAKMVKEKFHGKIPKTMAEILQIPGVARKTANVVLGNAHGVVEGIAVDTHVKRLAHVLGLSREHDPDKIERDLMQVFPQKDWFRATYLLIEYGRKYCPARKHDETKCPLGHYEKEKPAEPIARLNQPKSRVEVT
ncbi:MAG: endonuclease III [Parcubacteria group bacterium]|nr:endonuclease III [Parcubacteria group bacterium]